MGRFVNPDNSAFQAALNSRIYVDKTGLIACMNNILDSTDAYICNSRPRRFGKSYAANMLASLTRMMYMSESKMVVADALARIDSVLEAAPMQVQAVPQHPQDASVALQNVHFSYNGKNEVIKGVSLDIQPGQTVAFVGPSCML